MSVAQELELGQQVLEILGGSSEPLSLPDIEFRLKKQENWANTLDVRDAVAELIQNQQAEFVPGRLVRLRTAE